jgi:hypothetical protein
MERLLIWMGLGLAAMGFLLVAAGLLWAGLGGRGGRLLPGDIVISRPGFTFAFPVMTGLALSVILTLALWAVYWLRR